MLQLIFFIVYLMVELHHEKFGKKIQDAQGIISIDYLLFFLPDYDSFYIDHCSSHRVQYYGYHQQTACLCLDDAGNVQQVFEGTKVGRDAEFAGIFQ